MSNTNTETLTSVEQQGMYHAINQQNKLIDYITNADPDVFERPEVRTTLGERQSFFEDINSGEVNDANFREALMHIPCPINPRHHHNGEDVVDAAWVYSNLENNRQIKAIIAYFARGDMTLRDEIGSDDLATFYKYNPDPLTFESRAGDFMDRMSEFNDRNKMDQYKASMDEFQRKVYGERYNYLQQINVLKTEAEKYNLQGDVSIIQDAGLGHTEVLANSMLEAPGGYSVEQGNFEIETLDDSEIDRIMREVQITGSEYKGTKLTVDILFNEGLEPCYKIKMDDAVICCPSIGYDLGGGRVGVVAYVEKDGRTTANSYYRSNSQGVWRYLPDYNLYNNGGMWFGKGISEESVTLPAVLQKTLSEIAGNAAPKQTSVDPEMILAGNANRQGDRSGQYYQDTDRYSKSVGENYIIPESEADNIFYKVPPEQVQLKHGESPDFSNLVSSWESNTSLYGKVHFDTYKSNDGQMEFMFCKDEIGRAWIGNIEDNSEVQSTGLKKSWIKDTNLTTPAYEYKIGQTDQTDGYGNEAGRNGMYVDMFQNYISKIPVIQEYLQVSAERSVS